MGILFKFKQIIREYRRLHKFGIELAAKLSIIMLSKSESKRLFYYQKTVIDWLTDLLSTIEIRDSEYNDGINNGPVWVCWWQGLDAMPPIVKACWLQINNNVRDRPVILVTEENFKQYVDMPEIILKRLLCGNMSLTHFSDILRACLLYQNGGYWFDATIYTSYPIDNLLNSSNFYTLKSSYTDRYVSKGRWCGFNIGGQKGHPLFKYMVEAFTYYWKRYDRLIDYFLIDYVIATAYNQSNFIKKCIDNMAIPSENLYILQHALGNDYTDEHFRFMTKTPLHKLTWKFSEANASEGTLRAWIENICIQ